MFSRKEVIFLYFCMLIAGGIIYFTTLQHCSSWGGMDFARAYSVSELLRDGRWADVYNNAKFLGLVATHTTLTSVVTGWLYSPIYLLIIQPLAYLPYKMGFALSVVVQVMLFYAAGYKFLWHKASEAVWALSPTLLTSLFYAQNGVLIAALYIAAFRYLKTRPVLAGIFLGAIIIKPQMGMLIPVLLLAGEYYVVLFSAIASVAVLVAFSVCLYGVSSWLDYLHSMQHTNVWRIAEIFGMTSSYTMFYHAVQSPMLSKIAQVASGLMAAIIMVYHRDEWKHNPKTGLLFISVLTLFVSPYLGVYDYVLATTMIIFAALSGNRSEKFNYGLPMMLLLVSYVVFIETMAWVNMELVVAPLLIAVSYLYIWHDKRLQFPPETTPQAV